MCPNRPRQAVVASNSIQTKSDSQGKTTGGNLNQRGGHSSKKCTNPRQAVAAPTSTQAKSDSQGETTGENLDQSGYDWSHADPTKSAPNKIEYEFKNYWTWI
jgi:hypothetical protein